MLRKLYGLVKKLFMLFFFSSSYGKQPSGLLEGLVHNITAVYNCPGKFTSNELFNATETYLHELKNVENELKTNSTYILDIESVINDNSIPKHLTKVPLTELSKTYDWDENEVDRYMIAMSKTNRIWYNIVQFLKEHNSTLVHTNFNINYIQ